MSPDESIYRLASGQHALVTRRQLQGLGLTRHMIGERIRRGRLELVHRGVYRIPGSVLTTNQRTLAACLALGGVSAASHRTAARLWGLDVGADRDVIELVTSRPRSDRLDDVVVHRSVDLSLGHVSHRHGIPVTNPLRMLVDLGAVVPGWVVGNALDDLITRRLVTVAGVWNTLDELAARGRSGCGVLREVLEHRSGAELTIGRSRLEALLSDLCQRAGLGGLEFQHAVVVAGQRRLIDFAIPHLRIAIEVDGYQFHTGFDVFQEDRVRGNQLELAGWTVLHFTWDQVVKRPAYVLRVLRQAVAQAA